MKHGIIPLAIAALAAAILVGCNQDLAEFTQPGDATVGVAADTLIDYAHWGALYPHTYDLQKVLVYALQDEQLQQAEYNYVLETFGSFAPFRSIVRSEGTHVGAMTDLINQLGYTVPPNQSGQYIIPVGTKDEALQLGLSLEELNGKMYMKFLYRTDLPVEVRRVLLKQRDATAGHINQFRKALEH